MTKDTMTLRLATDTDDSGSVSDIDSIMCVNDIELPYYFSMPNFLYLLEHSGRFDFFHIAGGDNAIYSDVICDDDYYWIWRNFFSSEEGEIKPVYWHFEWKDVFAELKKAQNILIEIKQKYPDIKFASGGCPEEVINYRYHMPKKLWIDYLNDELAKQVGQCRKNSWKTDDDMLKRIRELLVDGAYIYKENKRGINILSVILEQPNQQLKDIVCEIANYPLKGRDNSTIKLKKNGMEKEFCAPTGISLREAYERDLLLEKY